MVLVIDNYDSFTYNLVQYFGELGVTMDVYRNDKITADEAAALKPSHIVISPGPGTPEDSGISNALITTLGARIPVLGVCLGHQCICQVHGAAVVRAGVLMHGKTSLIYHDGEGLFRGLPQPFEATRYHSLIVDPATVPEEIIVTARTEAGEIMGVRHRDKPLYGVQFHPESILSREGKQLLSNFLALG